MTTTSRARARRTASVVVLVLLGGLFGTTPAAAENIAHGAVVSAVPSTKTPYFTDGAVKAILRVGNRVIVGGTFTGVRNPGSTTTITRNYVAAFDAATGVVDPGFVPAVNGEVRALEAAADGTSVYLGGRFTSVNGVAVKAVALVRTATGASVAGFKVPTPNGIVTDLDTAGGRLYVGGTFTKVGTTVHAGLATVNPTTGAVDPFMGVQLAGHHNYNGSGVKAAVGATKLDITPDGTRMVVIGNFTSASGQARDQIVRINLSGAAASVDLGWNTSAFTPDCFYWAFDSYMRDVEFSPDGSYFVVVTTGGYYAGSFEACDAASRFETAGSGADVAPTWMNHTGTDSLYSVAVTGTAVYVGGHQRWLNNPYGQDHAGPGAVARPGLGALDPATGVPLAWNPGRHPRGHGAEEIYAGPDGLYVGSDTTFIGNRKYSRGRLAFFPLAGGRVLPPANTGTLPGNVYLAGRRSPTATNVLHRVNAAGPALQATDSGPDWSGDRPESPSPYVGGATEAASWDPVANVAATVPASTPRAVFDSERWGPTPDPEMAWEFPVAAGTPVQVRLYFANRYSGTSAPGQRVFDVTLDGATVLPNYDIAADAGDQTGTMKAFDTTAGRDGRVRIGFVHRVENPLINAIEIVRTDVAPPPSSGDDVRVRSYDGAGAVGATTTLAADGTAWSRARGAFMINGTLYYGATDSQLHQRSFNGTTFGPDTVVDPYNDPLWSSVRTGSGDTVYRGNRSGFYAQLPNVTGMFFADGRIHYTLFDDPALYSRAFSPDSGIVGDPQVVVDTTLDWRSTSGMFVANGRLYWATAGDGNLHRVSFRAGHPDAATATVVSGPGIDGNDWRSRALFLRG